MHTANDGRDPFPVLIGRHKVPKNRYNVESSFPAVVMELSDNEIKEYYTPKDFKLGTTVPIYGRKFLIYDCDNFTKAFYYHHFGQTEFNSMDVNEKVKQLPKMVCYLYQKFVTNVNNHLTVMIFICRGIEFHKLEFLLKMKSSVRVSSEAI